MSKLSAIRKYPLSESITFRKTKEPFGGLSNMAPGFSLHVNEVIIPTSEHLYQALRFPDHPRIQWDIINEKSPMRAKWIGRKHIDKTRKDWEAQQFKIMQWVLEIKLSQNWDSFSTLLRDTEGKNIVEVTPTPKVWGAVINGNICEGVNALGRLLMYLRESYVIPDKRMCCVSPLDIEHFNLMGHRIDEVCDEQISKTVSGMKRKFVFA